MREEKETTERKQEESSRAQDKEEPRRRQPLPIRIASLLLMLLLVLGSVALVVYREELNLDALRRTIAYHSVKTGENGAVEAFSYETDTTNLFAAFDGGILIASSAGYRQIARDGTKMVSESVYLKKPLISAGASFAAVYDAGGQAVRLLSGKETVLSLDLPDGSSVFSAHVNENDYFTLTTRENGYKASVSVYDDNQNPLFRWNSSARYVIDAAASEDGRYMAAATVGQDNAIFDAHVVLYRLDSETEQSRTRLGDVIPLEVKCQKSYLWVVCDRSAFLLDDGGEILRTYAYGGLELKGYSLAGDGYLVLLLGGHAGTGYLNLVRIDSDGETVSELPLRETVFSLSAAGRYIALLFSDRLELYDRNLDPYATLDGTEGAQEAIVRADGSVMLVGDGAARLYIP